MSRFTKWAVVAVLAVSGLAFSGASASAAERSTPVQTAYRGHHRGHGYYGGWNHGGWNYGGWNHRYHRWHR